MLQVFVNEPAPDVPAKVRERGCKLNASNAPVDVRDFQTLLKKEITLILFKYMLYDSRSGCGSVVVHWYSIGAAKEHEVLARSRSPK